MCQEMFFFNNFGDGNYRHANAWFMLLTGEV